jgi:crotonobetainyl-CoA:carnitine CoA-transferase CaiB-like acyl-CoA transferase
VRLVSLAQNVPGPVAVARLVQDGAAAFKVEPPQGDQLATLCPRWYQELHAGVRVARLDLKTEAGMAALKIELSQCDVLLTSQRPSALARLGLDAGALRSDCPHLRYLNIVGDSANPEQPGHDLTYQAQEGLIGSGMPLTLAADMLGAERARAVAIELMQQPPGTSRGVGLADALRDLAAPLRYGLTTPGGPLGGGNPAYRLYAARTGTIAVAALEPHFRARLYRLLERPDGSDLSDVFGSRTAAEWEAWAIAHDLPLVALRIS